ncbi:MAG: SlyX family protein [Rubellimicrobium sp.]|nr:SlyX family protein [Rubellimicrobium sp.]
MTDITPDTTRLEERIAHLTRTVDDLSDITAAQGREIDRLVRQMRFLLEREAEREADAFAPADPNQRPPHW